jgi:DNA invertase Pin-like site-specific DNA recombinase
MSDNSDTTSPADHPPTREEVLRLVEETISQKSTWTGTLKTSRATLVQMAFYGRLSKVEEDQHQYSLDIQPEAAEKYAKERGWEIVGIYLDPDKTGRNSKRKELQHLLRDIKSRKVDVLVIHRLDRLYRNLASLIHFVDLLEQYHVRLISITENIDTETAWGRLVLYVLGTIAEFYVRSVSERVREAKKTRFGKGLPNGSARYGFCNGRCSNCTDPNGPGYCPFVGKSDRGNGRVQVPHPIEQHARRLMEHLYPKLWSDTDIAEYLNTHEFLIDDVKGDGLVLKVRFRTKGVPGQFPPGPFTADSVRSCLNDSFAGGLIARYPSPPLDMHDEIESVNNPHSAQPKTKTAPTENRREAIERIVGQHEPIIPIELWYHNQSLRESKSHTGTSIAKPKRIFMYTGLARCWECHNAINKLSNLRTSPTKRGVDYCLCGHIHESRKKKNKPSPESAQSAERAARVQAHLIPDELAQRHRLITREKIENEITTLLFRLTIPRAWHNQIAAYYLANAGLAEFKRQGHELQQQLQRVQNLREQELLTPAQAQRKIAALNRELERLQPATQPEAAHLRALLADFPALWQQLQPIEQRSILQAIFTDLFFDATGKLRSIGANSPFTTLLGLSQENTPID